MPMGKSFAYNIEKCINNGLVLDSSDRRALANDISWLKEHDPKSERLSQLIRLVNTFNLQTVLA
jgi:hypothetical protein